LFRRGKQEDSDIYELKRQHQIDKEDFEKKLEDNSIEIDLL
jgi:hypothetical protein